MKGTKGALSELDLVRRLSNMPRLWMFLHGLLLEPGGIPRFKHCGSTYHSLPGPAVGLLYLSALRMLGAPHRSFDMPEGATLATRGLPKVSYGTLGWRPSL